MRLSLTILALAATLAVCAIGLFGCGSCDSGNMTPTGPNLIGTWTGTIGRAPQSLNLSVTFTGSGSNINGQAALTIFNESVFGTVDYLEGVTPAFPVTLSGNNVTFGASINDNSSTNVTSQSTLDPRNHILIVIPGRSIALTTFNLNVNGDTMTGTYQMGDPQNHSGSVTLTRSSAPPSLSGHWTGSTTSSLGKASTTMDFSLANNSSFPTVVRDTGVPVSTVASSSTRNTWPADASFGVDGLVIDNSFYFNINFVIFDPVGTSDRIFPHRYFMGTISGNTITGVYRDEFTALGLPNDTGTFTLSKQ